MTPKRRDGLPGVRRTKVRDGIIVGERVTVDLCQLEPADALEAMRSVGAFSLTERIIEGYAERARMVVAEGAVGSRLAYAENAIWQAGQVLRFLAENKSSGAVRHALWMMQSLWRVDMKEVEPVVLTGARVRKPFDSANKRKKNEAGQRVGEWQARAAKAWGNPQHADKGKSDIAKLIAQPGENWDLIRRRIKKPAKK